MNNIYLFHLIQWITPLLFDFIISIVTLSNIQSN
jgi:hypothetical protein